MYRMRLAYGINERSDGLEPLSTVSVLLAYAPNSLIRINFLVHKNNENPHTKRKN